MELREYWQVIKRRWKVGVVPALLILFFGLATYRPPGSTYRTEFQYIVGQNLLPSAFLDEESRYFHWVASEYVVNGLADWANGSTFAERVAAILPAQYEMEGNDISSRMKSEVIRSRLMIQVAHDDADELQTIVSAIMRILTEEHATAAPQLSADTARLQLIDEPQIELVPPSALAQLGLFFRLIVPLGILLVTAFLAEYFDPIIRAPYDLKLMDLPAMGEIPRQ